MKEWHCYLLVDGPRRHTYVGITTDLDRRLTEHNGNGKKPGAKRTRMSHDWQFVATVSGLTKQYAVKLEKRIHLLSCGQSRAPIDEQTAARHSRTVTLNANVPSVVKRRVKIFVKALQRTEYLALANKLTWHLDGYRPDCPQKLFI